MKDFQFDYHKSVRVIPVNTVRARSNIYQPPAENHNPRYPEGKAEFIEPQQLRIELVKEIESGRAPSKKNL